MLGLLCCGDAAVRELSVTSDQEARSKQNHVPPFLARHLPVAPKSNHSRTYENQGVGVPLQKVISDQRSGGKKKQIPRPRRSARGAQFALRGPTRQTAARKRKSGRCARDDGEEGQEKGRWVARSGDGADMGRRSPAPLHEQEKPRKPTFPVRNRDAHPAEGRPLHERPQDPGKKSNLGHPHVAPAVSGAEIGGKVLNETGHASKS